MELPSTEISGNHNFGIPFPPPSGRNALRATALNADKFPILARHWPGILIIGGRLACIDESPLARQFKTEPVTDDVEPG